MRKTYTVGERIFALFNYTFLTLLGLSMLFPFLHVLAISLSNEDAIRLQQVSFLPVGLTFYAYQVSLGSSLFVQSIVNSVIVTICGTILGVTIVFMAGYTLSKPQIKLRRPLLIFFLINMLFSGGLIPFFLVVRALGLYDTLPVLFLPYIWGTGNMLLVKNYLETLPSAAEESALLDGANYIQILFRIVLPMAAPIIATITLFYAVMFWNSWFPGIFLISKHTLKPLQTYLYDLLRVSNLAVSDLTPEQALHLTPEAIRSAVIMLSSLPILCVYPFLQKYFVKGIVIGSEK